MGVQIPWGNVTINIEDEAFQEGYQWGRGAYYDRVAQDQGDQHAPL